MRGKGPYNSLLNFEIDVIYFLVAGSNSGLGGECEENRKTTDKRRPKIYRA